MSQPESEEAREHAGAPPYAIPVPAPATAGLAPLFAAPWVYAFYRALVGLLLMGVLMAAAVRALMPGMVHWPIEQWHVNAAAIEEYRFEHARIPIDLDWSSTYKGYAILPPLPRFEGMRIRIPVQGFDTIRVRPEEVEQPPLPVERFQPEFVVEEQPPERKEKARRRAQPRPGGGPPGIPGGVPGRDIQGGQSELGSTGAVRRSTVPIYGPGREYPNDDGAELIGTRTITRGGPGSEASRVFQSPQDPEGVFGGFPPPTRTLTALRLLPMFEYIEAGTCQEYDLQAQFDYEDWYSVTGWPETAFRLKTPDRGVVQHRRSDNVFCVPADAPVALNGTEVVIEGSFQMGSGSRWTAQAMAIIVVPRTEAEMEQLLKKRPRSGFKPWHYRYARMKDEG